MINGSAEYKINYNITRLISRNVFLIIFFFWVHLIAIFIANCPDGRMSEYTRNPFPDELRNFPREVKANKSAIPDDEKRTMGVFV